MQFHETASRKFAKTEVALRAVFKCVLDGKQCAVLVPTTILAWQHYQTFLRRLEGYPVTVELLSRFRTPKQQKEILQRLADGKIDVVVGTHRLVQEDVRFRDLGLCVIDEEQRFGVKQKEKFKQLKGSVDILTLSATPIPRTLNMAMSGIRDMSVINEAPQDRHLAQKVALQFLFLPDSGFQPFQSGKALLRGGVGCGNGSVQLVRGRKAILLVEHEGSRHLFEVVHGRPLLIAPSFPLGSLGGYVYHALYSVIVRGVFRFFFRP